jgi:hypothetical protein
MNVKKIILLVSAVLLFNFSFSQEIIKGSLTKEVFAQWYSFKHKDNTILVQDYKEKREKEYLITILDSDLKEKESHQISHNDDQLVNVSFSDQTLYFLFQSRDKNPSQVEFYVIKVGLANFNESKQSLFSVSDTEDSSSIRHFFKFNNSFDVFGEVDVIEDYLAISYRTLYNEKKEKVVYLFDKNYNQIFKQSKIYSYDKRDQRFVTMSSFVDKTTNSLITLNRKKEGGDFILELVNKDDYKSKNFSFTQKSGSGDLMITKTASGIHCVGFYFNEEKKADDSIFYSTFSDDLELLEENYFPLTNVFFESLSKKQQKRGLLVNMIKILKDDFDNIYVIGEAGRMMASTALGTSNDDVIVCKIDNKSNLKWSTLVQKSQKFYYGGYAGFKPFLMNNKLHYIFNSEFDIKKVKTDAKSNKGMQPGSAQKFNVYLVSFDNNGEFTHQQLTDKKKDIRYMPSSSGLIQNESLFLFGSKKKENGFLKIQF